MTLYSVKRADFVWYFLLVCFLSVMVIFCGGKSPTDSGNMDKWVPRNDGLESLHIQFLAVHSINSDIVFAGTFDGLYKSTDGALTWTRVDSGWGNTTVMAIAFDSQNADVIYVGTQGAGLFKSEDGGESWRERNIGLELLNIYSIATDPQHSDTLFSGCDGGIFRSHDGAAEWSEVRGLPRSFVAIDPQNSQTVYAGGKWNGFHKSMDGGQTWSSSAEGLSPAGPSGRIQWVLIDPINPTILYVGTNNFGIFKSTDSAGHWATANAGLSGAKDVRVLGLDFSDTEHLYTATENGLFRSTDSGETWQQMNKGLTNVNVKALAVDPLRPHIIYAGTWGGGVFIWKSQ